MSKLHRFGSYINESEKRLSKKDQEQVDYFIDKFEMKMNGSTEQTAAGWVDGIGELSDDQKRGVWKGIQPFIVKEKGKRDLPAWINEGEINETKAPTFEDTVEMANIVYDTLMNNKQHEQFTTKQVDDGSHEIDKNMIVFVYKGKSYKLTVESNL